MSMSKQNREVEKSDLIAAEIYAKNRNQIRKKLVDYKKKYQSKNIC